jgi:hypothetical protein
MFKSVLSFAFQAEKDYLYDLYKEGQFYNLLSPCSHGPDRFPKQIVKFEFVKKLAVIMWASGFVLLYDFVYDMHAPVVIQYKLSKL